MATTLTTAALILLCATPPLLLIARFLRPTRVSWWLVLGLTAAISWGCLEVEDQLRAPVAAESIASCDAARAAGHPVPNPYCLPALPERASLPRYLLWWPGVELLALLLPVYGLAHLVRRYRRRRSRSA